ncbi:MAG: molecular chaperone Tir [Cyclobacteriaceae bacterium]|nr:molecular chaperone Tir [Cyclobacteriaceae bacterium]
MNSYFEQVQGYLLDLDFNILNENEEEGVFWVEKEDAGIHNLVIGCLDPILVMEQFLFEIKNESNEIYKSLLIKNRDIIHGAFVLDETGKKVIFRDTLQLENLDLNELEGSINSLSLLLSEYSDELIKFSKN